MQITSQLIKKFKWQNRIFYLLLASVIILTAMLSYKYQYHVDWTQNNQNSLNEKTIALLLMLDEPIKVRSFTNNPQIKKVVKRLLARYQQEFQQIQLEFIDPAQHPQQVRDLGIQVEGEIIIEMAERSEHLTQLTESKLTNSIFRLARKSKRKIVFVEGHGERRGQGKANFDLADLSQQLKKQGFEISSINLSQIPQIDVNNDLMVIAGPQTDFLPGEVGILLNYLEHGVNLLWLADPIKENHQGQSLYGLQALAERLGIEFSTGVVVDSTTRSLQLERPDYAIISDYIDHPLTSAMQTLTIFPQAAAIDPLPTEPDGKESDAFSFDTFLLTIEQSWVETSPVVGTIDYNADEDTLGPLIIGISQTRAFVDILDKESATLSATVSATASASEEATPRQQRVVVVGDGDFLSNAFVANAGNLELGLNIFNWLSQDDQFIAIPAKLQTDTDLAFTENELLFVGFGFFLVIPIIFVMIGLIIRYQRRKSEAN